MNADLYDLSIKLKMVSTWISVLSYSAVAVAINAFRRLKLYYLLHICKYTKSTNLPLHICPRLEGGSAETAAQTGREGRATS